MSDTQDAKLQIMENQRKKSVRRKVSIEDNGTVGNAKVHHVRCLAAAG